MAIIKINNNAIDLDAAEIPNLDASKITTGSLGTDRIPNLDASKITTGTITPSDGTVTTDKIVDANVTLAKLSATGTKDATTFLRGDNTFAEVPAGGITEADQWRITTNYNKSGSGAVILTANWERNDNGFSLIGTGMTESSGVFSFPTTGIYLINSHSIMVADGGARPYMGINIQATTNNSTYSTISLGYESTGNSGYYSNASCTGIFDVTNISTHKIRIMVSTQDSAIFEGNTNAQSTGITFIKLGDT